MVSGAVEVIRCRESSDYLHLSRGVCHGSGTRGWTGKLLKFWDKFALYAECDKCRGCGGDEYYVRGVEEGAADYGIRGRYDPPKLWFPCSFFVLFVVPGQGGTEVDTSAGALSEAKTQRRPHSARERE